MGECDCHRRQVCISPTARCNCDAADPAWSYDDGQLTDRASLPVTKLNFGNTDGPEQEARFVLGPLYCSGAAEVGAGPGCAALWAAGGLQTGYQLVDLPGAGLPTVVHWDTTRLPGQPGFQRNLARQTHLFSAYIFTQSPAAPAV